MTGLQKILKTIEVDASTLAEQTVDKARKEAAEILDKAGEKAENESELLIKSAETEAERILRRAESRCDLYRRETMLRAKRELIDHVLEEAKDTLLQWPKDEYFNMILTLIRRYIKPGETGTIFFCATDLKRMPKNFLQEIAKLSESSPEGQLKVAEQARDIRGGFILSYGDIEENCSIDALFDTKYGALADKVNELLFSV